ncbi:MarR family transcriptional regulator [Martelella lutilitoris]|uniref:MarR family transcriptional regulator n=1 Tax=Martelella lutilitoris TaxID=2583532 RepID=A0A5C4JVF5_9HYPH|nr:MarR family transcriptional regulator [Martelella lutilitoris]TNB49121.1 MarR family transcriptional regulator [Martelella lutilitoris]
MPPVSTQQYAAFVEALSVASRKMRTNYNAQVARFGLTFTRARVIQLLSKHETMNQSMLACELELEKPTVVRILDRMEAHDLIERHPDPADRRAKLIVLSKHGAAMADELSVLRGEIARTIFADMDPAHIDIATGVFEAIIARLDQLSEVPEDE